MPTPPARFGEREDEGAHTWGGLVATPLGAVDDGTLRRFHSALLEPAFPPAELVTYEALRDARLQATTRGTILFDGADPVAGIVTEDYLGGRVLLVAYLVVAATARGGGIGARLLSEVTQRRATTPLVLAEIEDPRCFAASDAGDPVARVRFYDRVGSRLLPLPYVQPSLRPGSPRVDGLLLITIGASGPDVDGALVAAFLDEYYGLHEREEVVRTDPAYLALRAAALGDEHSRLPLLPLSAFEAARPHPASYGPLC
ncbi:MAG: GNAT family N-acetyltransferase [Pseudonocardiaceae bacterium]